MSSAWFTYRDVSVAVATSPEPALLRFLVSGIVYSPRRWLFDPTVTPAETAKQNEARLVAVEARGIEALRHRFDTHWLRYKVVDTSVTTVPMAMVSDELRHSFVVSIIVQEVVAKVKLERPDAEWNF